MSLLLAALPVMIALWQPGSEALAQAVEVEEGYDSGRIEPPAKVDADSRADSRGQVYTWQDGDHLRRVYLQRDLIETRDAVVAPAGTQVARTARGVILRVAGAAAEVEGQPVFRSASGSLMTLPGGVLLMLDPAWSGAQTDAFLAANGISRERIAPLGTLPNAFVIDTEPGLASLRLANELAGREGVRLSSPNWWREHTTR